MRRRALPAIIFPTRWRTRGSFGPPPVLGPNTAALDGPRVSALVQRLHELGWIEGRTIAIEYRWAEGRNEHLAEIAAEFVRLKVDVIVTSATPTTVAVKKATSSIPVVFASVGDPIGAGLVASLIGELALGARLPTMYGAREYVEAGGLMSYAANFPDLYRRTAEYVDKILRGAKPSDLPVEQPTKFDLIINLKTAKTLGLTIPPTMLTRADEVIE